MTKDANQLMAHSPGSLPGPPHWLLDHLEGTARLAVSFLHKSIDPGWGAMAGNIHDLGKAPEDWQAFIQARPVAGHGPDHSTAGAIHVARTLPGAIPVCFAIAGHHGGIPDREDLVSRLQSPEKIQEVRKSTAGHASGRPWPRSTVAVVGANLK